jgi:MATE family multidrug resistance protein
LRIAGFGMAPALIIMVLKSYLSALERTQVQLWITLCSVVLNFCVAWAFIFGHWGAPEMGVRGAALATLLTQCAGAGLLALYAAFEPSSRRFHPFHRFWRPDWPAFRRVFRLGLPVGLTGLAESCLFVAASLMMGWIGTIELAAHGIAMEIASVTFMVHLGLSNAATVRIGRVWGEGDTRAMRDCAAVATAMSAFLDAAKPETAEILAFGSLLLAMAALFQFFDAMQVVGLGLLRGVQDTAAPMWIAAVSYWAVGVPASYLLAFHLGFGGPGLWLGLAIGLAAAAALLMLRFWRGPWFRLRSVVV